MHRRLAIFLVPLAFVACHGSHASPADNWIDPPVFASENGNLNLMLVAKPKTFTLGTFQPTGWVYEACNMLTPTQTSCPANSNDTEPYGGIRIQAKPGDNLNIRLVNQLPPTPQDAEHLTDMGNILLANPTNIHTHGLIVEPRQATAGDPTYGDYVYIYGYPSGQAPNTTMPNLTFTDRPIDYSIAIPANHPSGLYWFHPHVHGLSLNQITAGLAGLITIGSPTDYLAEFSTPPVTRHLTLKDMQIMQGNVLLDQGHPDFCSATPANASEVRHGSCPGVLIPADGANPAVDYRGGAWFFTVSGQVYPQMGINSAGELWRIANTSGSRTAVLQIQDDVSGAALPFQVVALDGVALNGSSSGQFPGTSDVSRVNVVPCPNQAADQTQTPICADQILMMPSTRVELWIPGAGPNGSTKATLVSQAFGTGPAGDDWPYVQMAHLAWSSAAPTSEAILPLNPEASSLLATNGIFSRDVQPKGRVVQNANNCVTLGTGYHRRIYYGIPVSNPDAFGLGYELVDPNNNVVPGSFVDVAPFDDANITVCLPLASGNMPVTELWELINVTGEDHNFHVHQTKFQVLTGANATDPLGAMMDSVPLPHGDPNCDATVATYKSGGCIAYPVFVQIPFSQVGDFVYHCHILEHEDGGMMAHISVVPNP